MPLGSLNLIDDVETLSLIASVDDESIQVTLLASGDSINGQGGCTEVTLLPELRASRHRQQQQGRIA